MNLLEFKRFAELRKQYNWLVIDDPNGDGKYKIDDIDIRLDIEPVVKVLDPLAISAFLKEYEHLYSQMHVATLKNFSVDMPISDIFTGTLSQLTLKPLVVVFGERSNLKPYIECLKLLSIDPLSFDLNLNISGRISLIGLLSIFLKTFKEPLHQFSEIELLQLCILWSGQFKDILEAQAAMTLLTRIYFKPDQFKEVDSITAALASLNRLLMRAGWKAKLNISTPMSSPTLLGFNIEGEANSLINAFLTLTELKEFDVAGVIATLKPIVEFSILSFIAFTIQDKQSHNMVAKLNVVFPDPDVVFQIHDKGISAGIAPLIFASILSFISIVKIKLKDQAVVKSAIWAKLIDYENYSLESMNSEDLEELYLFEV